MIIKVTTNIDEIKTVLCDPEIFYKISSGQDIETYEPPLIGCLYLIGYVDKKIIGLSCFHGYKNGFKFHPNVIKRYRAEYGRDFVQKTANMLKCCLYVEIPKNRRGLVNLAKKVGFSESEKTAKTIVMQRF